MAAYGGSDKNLKDLTADSLLKVLECFLITDS